MDESPLSDDQLASRLQGLGQQPVDPWLASRVLARVQAGAPAWWRSTKLKVGGGVMAGFLAGSVGLASADTLPGPAQDVAHHVLGAVGISVPPGQSRYNGPECGGTYRNHGQYVRAHHGQPGAGSSPCGRPEVSVTPGSSTTEVSEPPGTGPGSHGHGPPPWAHGGKGDNGTSSGPGSQAPDDSSPTTTEPGGASSTSSTTSTTSTTTVPGTTSTTAS